MERNCYNKDGSLKDMDGITILPKIIGEYDTPRPPALRTRITAGECDDVVRCLKTDTDLPAKSELTWQGGIQNQKPLQRGNDSGDQRGDADDR